ncbi:MAG: glycoside hydrolase family 99-like domain-containing protein [Gallionella sp.]|nr:glycoside hydrolase family 99-like domain-containing protein [Gallionella sp.]MDD4957821.1 glycoside hydrolase family 99-like domain-containing protein [Gallionella sp.]
MIDIRDWPLLDKENLFDYLRWNSYRSERYKLLYVSTPKVACTSLKWWFAALEGHTQALRGTTDSAETDPDLVIHDTFYKVAPDVTGLMPEALSEVLTSDSYFRFAVVRNPYKRIFSAWQSKLLLREPLQISPYLKCNFFHRPIECSDDIAAAFEDFLEHLVINEAPSYWDVHWTPQATLLRPDLINYSKLVKIENAKELSQALAIRLGGYIPDPFANRRTNESLIPYLPEFVTERSSDLIRTLYAEDFETFGYSKQVPDTKETFSDDQFNLAFKAIALIRGRHQRMTERDVQISSLNQALASRESQINNFQLTVADRELQIRNLYQVVAERDGQIISYFAERDRIMSSTSWKITKPLRFVRESAVNKPNRFMRKTLSGGMRLLWHKMPFSTRQKLLFKHRLFSNFPALLSWSKAYRSWVAMNSPCDETFEFAAHQVLTSHPSEQATDIYVPLLQALPPKNIPIRLIAFYLPQFHAIAENNAWWGEGFTEWTNVKPAQPQFEGHYQPHQPGELGYYNLLDSTTQHRQIELAKLYGVGGFCFYTYWFGGKLLLEKPIENYLADPSLDLPFCLCWANENWSRRWDGLDSEILIGQKHSPEDDLAFIQHIAQYLKDERYIRIDGKPLLLVYRPSLLPSVKATAKRWREWCLKNGIGEIYLAYTQSFETADPKNYGFDAAIEFPPNNSAPPNITDTVKPLSDRFGGTVYNWQIFVERSRNYQRPDYKLFRSVCPSWDNTARRKNKGTVFLNSTPKGYQEWLENAVAETCDRTNNLDERLIFVNAWNEWAEGAHLEPDQRNGYAYLEATRRALTSETKNKKIILVSHDAHPHGAQFLALGMLRALKQDLRLEVEVVLLGKGRLVNDFSALATVHDLSDADHEGVTIRNLANSLTRRGFKHAIVNTTVSGSVIPAFKDAGIESICLVHELAGVIQNNHLEEQAKQIAAHAKAVVFPAQIVADGFSKFAVVEQNKQIIRPQGLFRRNRWRNDRQTARRKLRDQLGLNANTNIVLTVGYVDHRKGADLLVECALNILAKRGDIDFVWVGHWEQEMQYEIEKRLQNNPLKNRIHFVGYNPDTALFHAGSDVYALTSREDPFPNVVLESFDAGVPVVAFSGTGGAASLVEKVGGKTVPSFDMILFSDAICQLLDNKETSSDLGTVAQNHIDDHFAFRPYIFELCEILGITLPKVSVIVPNYNYSRYIEERLASIKNQTIPIFELIILDDASTDQSVAKISNWLALNHVEAKVVINETNSGSVFSQWQKGISLATGDFVWIAEADDLSEPDFLETVVSPLVSGRVVLSYCDSQQFNADGITQAKNYRDYLSPVSQEKWKRAYIESGADECKSSLAILNTIPNVSAVVFKRDVIDSVFSKYFDEIVQFKKAGDWVVYLKVLAGGSIAFSPRTANLHRRHEQSVIGGGERQSLLREIIAVQEMVENTYQLTEDVKQKAQTFRLGLAD